jgi:hypothetical protein
MNKYCDPEHIQNLAAGFVVDDLTPKEEEEFRLLLDGHPELITEVEDLQEVLRQVIDGFTEVKAPAYLLPKILEQVEDLSKPTTVIKGYSKVASVEKNCWWYCCINCNSSRSR